MIDDCDAYLLKYYRWYENGNGYISTKIRNKKVYLHRVIACAKEGEHVDHINGDTRDNRRLNLRIVTRSENLLNRTKPTRNELGFRGVYKNHGRFVVKFKCEGVTHRFGNFATLEDAARCAQRIISNDFSELKRVHQFENGV